MREFMTLQERLETIRSSPVPKNEESAKVQILVPILQSLGWDPSEMLLEHAVGETRRRGRVDIALKTHGRIVALIEAKTPGTVLDNHVDQVLGYAYYESADICALTTGLVWWLYLPAARVPVSKRRFAVLRIMEDPSEQLVTDLTTFLSRETLASGQAEQRAKARLEEVRLNSEVPSIWEGMLREPDDDLIALLQRRVHERAHLRLTNEQVMAALQGSPIPSATIPTGPDDTPLASETSAAGPSGLSSESRRTPTAIELWGERHDVNSNVDAYRTFLDLLCERHRDDFDRAPDVSLPNRWVPHVARRPDGLGKDGQSENYEPKQSGIFFTEHSDLGAIKEIATALLKHFGHSALDFKVLYD